MPQLNCFEKHHFGILKTKFNQSRSAKYCPKLPYLQILNLKINESRDSRLFPAWAFPLPQTSPPNLNTI